MQIKFRNLFITDYDSNDLVKVSFTKELKDDELIKKYVSPDIEKWIKLSENEKRLCIGPGYLVGYEDYLIGAIKISNLTKVGYLNFDYMVNEKYRNNSKHYGNILLSGTTELLLNYFLFTRGIELAIDKTNTASIKTALSAGYQYKRNSNIFHEMDIYSKERYL